MEDSKIIDLYFAGSDQAIEETSIKYGGYLNQIAYNILRDSSDTEEIVNDTYLGAWNAIPPTRPNSLKHYLSRITRNLSFNRLDYKLAGKRSAVLIELDECIPDKYSEVEIVLEAKEIGRLEITNRDDISELYQVISNMTCYGNDNWDMIDYGASDTGMVEGIRKGRYLIIELANGNIIDGLKYTGISGMFYEFSGIAYNKLDDASKENVERILEIDK